MIPENRPVHGADIVDLRDRLGATAGAMANLLGVSMIKWTKLIKDRKHDPIDEPAVEIIVRFLDANPKAAYELPMLVRVTAKETYEEAAKLCGEPIAMKDFAVSLGRQASSGHRWNTREGHSSETLNRVLWLYLWNLRRTGSPNDARRKWELMVKRIGAVNNLGDVFITGHWNKLFAREERKGIRVRGVRVDTERAAK